MSTKIDGLEIGLGESIGNVEEKANIMEKKIDALEVGQTSGNSSAGASIASGTSRLNAKRDEQPALVEISGDCPLGQNNFSKQ